MTFAHTHILTNQNPSNRNEAFISHTLMHSDDTRKGSFIAQECTQCIYGRTVTLLLVIIPIFSALCSLLKVQNLLMEGYKRKENDRGPADHVVDSARGDISAITKTVAKNTVRRQTLPYSRLSVRHTTELLAHEHKLIIRGTEKKIINK